MSVVTFREAKGFWMRLLGMGFSQFLKHRPPLLFANLKNVHSLWMRAPIEVIALSQRGVILQISVLLPLRFFWGSAEVRHILEAKRGFCSVNGWEVGDQLRLVKSQSAESVFKSF